MEIINKNSSSKRCSDSWIGISQSIFMGSVLLIAGVIWLLYNLDVVGSKFFDFIFSWQMLLVVLGGYLLVMRRWIAGWIFTIFGLTLIIIEQCNLHVSFREIILPVLLISAGVAILLSIRCKGSGKC